MVDEGFSIAMDEESEPMTSALFHITPINLSVSFEMKIYESCIQNQNASIINLCNNPNTPRELLCLAYHYRGISKDSSVPIGQILFAISKLGYLDLPQKMMFIHSLLLKAKQSNKESSEIRVTFGSLHHFYNCLLEDDDCDSSMDYIIIHDPEILLSKHLHCWQPNNSST